ncbi:MAG TPA: polyprenyl synthetase family protein [Nakamurella sp.]|jgi:geranylgeranyl diphosphate synthase type I|nr:polyprenyl synthetase family protein [Nakamurella sp.]
MTSAAGGVLDSARSRVEPAMRAAIARLDPANRAVAEYHLGYADVDGNPVSDPGGKGVRGALALLSAQAAGAAPEVGVPAAVACELVHNFSLLHDDIMDADTTRRHRATAWTVFGTSAAILAGDAMLGLATEVLAEAEAPTVPWAVRCLSSATRRLIAGQAADLDFESDTAVSLEQCRDMAAGKTGALLACAASLGSVLADAPAALTMSLADFGYHVGMAFQLVDDLLGIWGAAERTGKPVASDLASRKKSLPVVAAMVAGGPHAERLAELYAQDGSLSEAELAEAAAAVEAAGGRAWTLAEAERETAEALAILDELPLTAQVREDLVAVTRMLCGRDH